MFTQENLKQAKLLVVGDIMLDRYSFGDTQRISPEAPVPIVLIQKNEERLGAAANVARNSAALGAKTGLLGVIGNDEAGQHIMQLLDSAQITSHLHIEPGATTTIKQRILARQQQLLRMDFDHHPKPSIVMQTTDTFKSIIHDYQVIVLSDYGKGGLAQVVDKISIAKAAQKQILIDPKGSDYRCYKGATLITPNRNELRMVVGQWRDEEDLTMRAQNLREQLQLSALLLTRSEEGMTLYTEKQILNVPTQAREVYDVSGAGDTVIAVLAVTLALGMPLTEAVHYANQAAGLVVSKLGTATVSYQELFV